MAKINSHYLKLKAGYLFPEIGRRVKNFQEQNPNNAIIKLGIGDVVLPLIPAVTEAFHKGVDQMGSQESFKGYGPEQGYPFLREEIAKQYQNTSYPISADEVFVSDGSKCDSGNIQEIFANDTKIAVTDPVYPVYVDTNVMAGRTGDCNDQGYYEGLVYLPATSKNDFSPPLPSEAVDLIYLCSPNNPTGTVLDHAQLKKWVEYASQNNAIILFDAAYEAFIADESLPRSIFEIEGAEKVAIEFRSFSKTAGFTGTRLAYTVVPKALKAKDTQGEEQSLHSLWLRRQSTKFNGVSYPVQLAGMACFSDEGKAQIKERVAYYMENAKLIREGLQAKGIQVYGGKNAPYIWLETPKPHTSWEFFDYLLNTCQIVGTPGSGFGPSGEGYFRLSAFALREKVIQAIERIQKNL